MAPDKLQEAIKRLSNRKLHDKFSLYYIIRIINHKKYFYSYTDTYKRDEWLQKLIEEISLEEGFNRLVKLETFKDLS